MAHGREGPDIVMQIRYAGASEVRAVTDHELHRSPDGWSAIDPDRTDLNTVLHGPASQQDALDVMWSEGVKKPAQQAEDPFVQMVLSASPSYFRGPGQGPGEWDDDALELWRDTTMNWLRLEYGEDLAHVSLHLDEETPHMHVLIVPTYQKKARKPGRQKKGETPDAFAARVAEADARATIRTAGRSSSEYWSRMFCRRDARRSYYAALEREGMGIGYGKDFVSKGEPSPDTTPTGTWVRQESVRLADERARLNADRAAVDQRRAVVDADAEALAEGQTALAEGQTLLDAGILALATDRAALDHDRTAVAEDRASLNAAAAALALDRTALDHDRATLDAAVVALEEGQMTLAAESAAAAERHAKNYQAATRWAEQIKKGRAEIAEGKSALLNDRAQLENEKANVAGLSVRLSALLEQVEKALRFVKAFAPRIRRVTLDAEASADERAAALLARAEIVQAVPPLRHAVSEYTEALFTRRRSVPLSSEKLPEPVDDAGPGFGEP